jgi:hypothetical protein
MRDLEKNSKKPTAAETKKATRCRVAFEFCSAVYSPFLSISLIKSPTRQL